MADHQPEVYRIMICPLATKFDLLCRDIAAHAPLPLVFQRFGCPITFTVQYGLGSRPSKLASCR